MLQADRDSYYRALKDEMKPYPWKKGTSPFNTWSEAVAFFTLMGTLIPVLPLMLWALFSYTATGQALLTLLPGWVHPVAISYALSSMLVVITFSVFLIIESRAKNRSNKSHMSELQTLFYLTYSALDSLRSYQVHNKSSHLERAKENLRLLRNVLAFGDPRRSPFDCPLFKVPNNNALAQLDLMLNSCAKVLSGMHRVPFLKLREVLESMTIIFFSYLPDLDGVVHAADLAQIPVETSEAWKRLESAVSQLPDLPLRKDETPASTDQKRPWSKYVWAFVLNFLVGAAITVALGAVPLYIAWNNVDPKNHDLLVTSALTAGLALSGAIAVALFNRGVFNPSEQPLAPTTDPHATTAKARKGTKAS